MFTTEIDINTIYILINTLKYQNDKKWKNCSKFKFDIKSMHIYKRWSVI